MRHHFKQPCWTILGCLVRFSWPCVALLQLFAIAAVAAADSPSQTEAHRSVYREKLKPLLASRCFSCHGGLKQEAGLRLDTVELMLEGGESGAIISKEDPGTSLILSRVSDPDPASHMPPEGEGEPLTPEQVSLLKDWIVAGAPAPADEKPEADPRDHWAFQPRTRPAVPAVTAAAWIKNPIDAFLANGYEHNGLTPQPEAQRSVLIRRLYLDLIGLPPTAAQLALLESDQSPDWYTQLVDQLLADPQHGVRWARHWMDIWRFSDWWGLGEEVRNSQKHMWHWRDWIIESLNADTPYDEMVRQMLAADEIYPDDPTKLRATGYLVRNYFTFNRTPWMDETVEHVGKGLLGLTMNCSKCHDHKFDPIQQEDFYKMRAFFEPYHVRLDIVPGQADLAQDGLPRVYDGVPEMPTYLFVRGEDTKPDTSRSIQPGVPEVIAFKEIVIQPVSLPKTAFQPQRQPWVIEAHATSAANTVKAAEQSLTQAIEKRTAAERAVAAEEIKAAAGTGVGIAGPSTALANGLSAAGEFRDDFSAFDSARWKTFGGSWKHEPGRMLQGQDGATFGALRLASAPPRNFDVTAQFTILGGSQWRSVGLAFDVSQPDPSQSAGADDSQLMIYASAVDNGQKVQASYTTGARWEYPVEGKVSHPIAIGRSYSLRVAARDTLVNVWLDGRELMAWRSPIKRRDGAMQFTTFDCIAAFHGVLVAPLADSVKLREPTVVPTPDPTATPTGLPLEAARNALAVARLDVALSERSVGVAQAKLQSVQLRGDAMRAAWAAEDAPNSPAPPLNEKPARAALQAEREVAIARAHHRVAEVELNLAKATEDKKPAIQKQLTTVREEAEKAVKAEALPGDSFVELIGSQWSPTRFRESRTDDKTIPFQPTSTGRRRALAQWITDPRNPLTARVAVNHIWMRHMGKPMVSTVFDFGRKGNAPVNPELLDWLASELVDHQWNMKQLHRLIVTSAAYRMSSSTLGAESNAKLDPDNRLLWRREPIRLEAQVIRDCSLAIAGTLELAMGGPSVPPSEQANSKRRSIYFFHSNNDRNLFLSLFDEADVKECYQRDQSIVPQQALALSNAKLIHDSASRLSQRLSATGGTGAIANLDADFISEAFLAVLGRRPSQAETATCLESIGIWQGQTDPNEPASTDSAKAHLVWALFNHNDFVTLR